MKLEAIAGESIQRYTNRMIETFKTKQCKVQGEFNGSKLVVDSDKTTSSDLMSDYVKIRKH